VSEQVNHLNQRLVALFEDNVIGSLLAQFGVKCDRLEL
jgi:hypothetical protein